MQNLKKGSISLFIFVFDLRKILRHIPDNTFAMQLKKTEFYGILKMRFKKYLLRRKSYYVQRFEK